MTIDKQPFFSIIIPTLNEEKYLPQLLADLSHQTSKDFEVIVVDGQSTDRTAIKAKSFSKKLPAFKFTTSNAQNVSIQRNLGAKNASGKYLLFNDADNSLPPYFLEGIKYQLRVRPLDIFTGWFIPDSDMTSDKVVATYMNLTIEAAALLGQPAAYGALIGCRRSIFKDINGFDPSVGFAEDTDFVNRGAKIGYSFGVFHEPRFTYSFRRFRKIGKLKLIQKYAKLQLKFLTNQKVNQPKEYPMGGGYLEEETRITTFLSKITQKNPKKTGIDNKIAKTIKALLSLEEVVS